MAIKDIFKVSRKTYFNPAAWIGYSELKNTTRILWGNVKLAVTPEKAERTESFAEAMQRLNLTDADVAQTGKQFFLYALFFATCGAIAFIMSFVMLFYYQTLSGMILSFLTMALFLSQAFRFHFWYFQIKHQKLGCTWQEWWAGKVFDAKEPKV